MFFHFSQNNSGGHFDHDKNAGITHHVLIEADDERRAVQRAEEIGLYFDGCAKGMDCSCCGDRWSDFLRDGTPEPMVYETPAKEYRDMWFRAGEAVAIHYKDGRIEWA